jgi:1-deoxy-D-xylulose-5-phosphate synthase
MLYTGITLDVPSAVRYPRGAGPGVRPSPQMRALPLGKAKLRRGGRRVALLAFGSMLQPALVVGDRLDATVVNMRFVKPLDEALLLELAASHELLVTIEENVLAGGAGSAVNECLARHQRPPELLNLGLPDRFIEQGEREELLADCGLDAVGIERAIRHRLHALACQTPSVSVNS